MNQSIYNAVKPLLEVINNTCGNSAFVTGSRVIGGEQPMSDVNVVIMVDRASELRAAFGTKFGPAKDSAYNNGIKYQVPSTIGLDVNIIPLHPVDFCAWAWTTNILSKSCVCRNLPREKRHRTFELGVLAFKSLHPTAGICNCKSALDWYFKEIPGDIKLSNVMAYHDSFTEVK